MARATAALATLATGVACDRDRPAPPIRESTPPLTVEPMPVPPADSAPAPTSTWAGEAGLALVVPGGEGEAYLVVPGTGDGAAPADTAAGVASAVLPGAVTLYGRGGLAGEARATLATEGAPADGCAPWPQVRLGPAAGADAVPGWTLGLVHRAGETAPPAIALDSLEALHGRDSASVTATVTRLAAALPATKGRAAGRFRGLPFVVRSARRFAPDSATEAIVAVLGRALAQESAPQAEEVLLVAEHLRGAAWSVAHSERVSGPEETLPAVEVLGALRVGASGRPMLVLGYDLERGSRYSLLEREGPGTWRVRWTSVRRGGC